MRGRWTTWALAGSLLANVVGGGYALYRVTRPEPRPPTHYQDQRADLFAHMTERTANIVMLGDSLTDRGEWHELLGLDGVANRGIAGDTIRGAHARIASVVALEPAWIVIMLGINDLLRGRSVEACLADHAALVQTLRAQAPRARLVIQSVLPVRPPVHVPVAAIAALNHGLRSACAAGACVFVDVGAALAGADGLLDPAVTSDGVHLDGAGYLRWRDALRPHLAP